MKLEQNKIPNRTKLTEDRLIYAATSLLVNFAYHKHSDLSNFSAEEQFEIYTKALDISRGIENNYLPKLIYNDLTSYITYLQNNMQELKQELEKGISGLRKSSKKTCEQVDLYVQKGIEIEIEALRYTSRIASDIKYCAKRGLQFNLYEPHLDSHSQYKINVLNLTGKILDDLKRSDLTNIDVGPGLSIDTSSMIPGIKAGLDLFSSIERYKIRQSSRQLSRK